MIPILVLVTILATSAVTVPLTYLYARRPRLAFPPRQRQLLDESMSLLWRFLHPADLDRFDTLSDQSKEAAERLLTRYQKEIR
jgi:hypothetical protein